MSRDYVNSLPLVLPLPSQREQTIVSHPKKEIILDEIYTYTNALKQVLSCLSLMETKQLRLRMEE